MCCTVLVTLWSRDILDYAIVHYAAVSNRVSCITVLSRTHGRAMKLLVSVFVALSLAAWSAAQTPIPSRPQGTRKQRNETLTWPLLIPRSKSLSTYRLLYGKGSHRREGCNRCFLWSVSNCNCIQYIVSTAHFYSLCDGSKANWPILSEVKESMHD